MTQATHKYEPEFSFALLHPRLWFTWLWLGLGWLVAQLPYPVLLFFGKHLGHLIKATSSSRRHVAEVNLKLCFPEKSELELNTLLNENFESTGIAVFETLMSWWSTDKKLKKLVQAEGIEHLEEALKENKGAVLLSAHFTTLEIGGKLLSFYHPFSALYRKHKNPVFEYIMHRRRNSFTQNAIERGNMRKMIKCLKNNEAVWYAPDQNYGKEHSIFVKFFGIEASTITATSRIASVYNSPVVPFFQKRLPGNQGYKLYFYPALKDFPSNNIEKDTQRINDLIEKEVKKLPEQYLWAHRRFKTRPTGTTPVY